MITDKYEELDESKRLVHKSEVERFIVDCLVKVGTEESKAKSQAAILSEADYRGHYSHGLSRLGMYVNDIKGGVCDQNNDPKILKESPVTAWVDGCNGLGVTTGNFCMGLAIQKAKESGIGWVAAKGSNHFGICQWYTNMAAKEGLVGMASTNTSPLVAPTRAKQRIIGTNPLCVSAPSSVKGDPLIVDMSISSASVGKIEIQLRKNEPMPSPYWALDRDGRPTRDPFEAYNHGAGIADHQCCYQYPN